MAYKTMGKLTARMENYQAVFGSEIFEIVPNVNVGRDRDLVCRIVDALSHVSNFSLLHFDCGLDADRTVFTGVGSADGVYRAGMLLYEVVLRHARFCDYAGVHPSVGLVDVFPIVPLASSSPSEAQFAEACQLAVRLGKALGDEYLLPIYSYELSQQREYRRHLFQIRRGGLAGLMARAGELSGVAHAGVHDVRAEQWLPDFGCYTERIAETGASVIGVRPLLLAVNFTLREDRLEVARRIAAKIRSAGRGGMPGVRAIGWRLTTRGVVQVSVNIFDLRSSSLYDVYARVVREAAALGGEIVGTELIGCLPKSELLNVGFRVVSGFECSASDGGRGFGRIGESQERYLMGRAMAYLRLEKQSASDIERRLILGL